MTDLIAVAGTLAGAILGAILGALTQARTDRRHDADQRQHQHHADLRDALAGLDTAVTTLRRTQVHRFRLRITVAPDADRLAAKAKALDQRTEVNHQWTQVQLLTVDPALLEAVEALALNAFDLHDAPTHQEFEDRQAAAHDHRAHLLQQARRVTIGASS